jgi:hypothetical protein
VDAEYWIVSVTKFGDAKDVTTSFANDYQGAHKYAAHHKAAGRKVHIWDMCQRGKKEGAV